MDYHDAHIDIMDQIGAFCGGAPKPKLHELAVACGLPGKLDVAGLLPDEPYRGELVFEKLVRAQAAAGKAQFAQFWTAWKGASSGTAMRDFAVDSGAVTMYFGSNEFSRNLCRQQAEDIRPTSARLLMGNKGRQIQAQSGFHCSGLATDATPLQSSISPTRNDPLLSRLPMPACMR